MGAVVRVIVTGTKGSTPRESGASMLVWRDGQSGSIGGGTLEFEAAKHARQMLAEGRQKMQMQQALGPELGQCCGGSVALEFELFTENTLPKTTAATPIWIFGAGHVGRALAGVLAPFPEYSITLIDTEPARFPTDLPTGVTPLTAVKMQALVSHAPTDTQHFIMTMSHKIDLEICHALLNHSFAYAGLIGSKTKWARFGKNLQKLGHASDDIKRITCPIGDTSLGKAPQAIAVGIAHGLLVKPGGRE